MIGKWNKSVILTYIGLGCSLLGFYFSTVNINYTIICLVLAGICDLFDGFVARKIKRNEEEKNFGIQLDSLVDVVSFGIFPIILCIGLGFKELYCYPLYIFYLICAIARLAYFNITITDNSEPVKYYTGLPVTFAAMIFALSWLLKFILEPNLFKIVYLSIMFLTSILYISKIKIKKPKGLFYLLFSLMAISMIIFCLLV